MEGKNTHNFHEADLVLFTGGEDVDPITYNQESHPRTYSNIKRDKFESVFYKEALKQNKHIVGICRGAQFLCAMNGGILIQDQQNHNHTHSIYTYDNKTIMVNSLHHQAQYPWLLPKDKYEILGWSIGESKYHLGWENNHDKEMVNKIVEDNKEVENVYYPETKCLTIQSHPEMLFGYMNYREFDNTLTNTIEYFRVLLNKFMENNL